MTIKKVAVIGAGVMGSNIAAHLANAGIPTYLLDIVPSGSENRNVIAEKSIAKLLKIEPAPLMQKKSAQLLIPGNIEDHLAWLSEVDWVVEAVVEDLAVKQALYKKLSDVCRDNCLITSNTSTLLLRLLVEGLPADFQKRFMITHFFNPPRYMRLLEIVRGPYTSSELVTYLENFADIKLGKDCVYCKDTPGFIANRIGTFWLLCGMQLAITHKMSLPLADAIISQPFSIPKTGIFGLLDLVGLDLIPHILNSLCKMLPSEDLFHQVNQLPAIVQQMIDRGLIGRKGPGGFYRLTEINGIRTKEVIDLSSGAYQKINPTESNNVEQTNINAILASNEPAMVYAWRVMSQTLCYAATVVEEIADDIVSVDTVMREGYNWKYGPFELLDRIGIENFVSKLASENRTIPELFKTRKSLYTVANSHLKYIDFTGVYQPIKRPPGVVTLADIKLCTQPVLSNDSASLWDIADGVACLEFHSKMNTIDMAIMQLIRQTIERVSRDFIGLVIYNEAENFSVGANLSILINAIHRQNWLQVEQLLREGQETYKALKYTAFPVVGAPSGMALGGGCEILLHCSAVQAHAELYTGLVEVGVGLIPAWGGCKEYLYRCQSQPKRFGGPIPPVVQAFETIGMAKVSNSAHEARDSLFIQHNDEITMNRNRLLADAKNKVLQLHEAYVPPEVPYFTMPGKTADVLLNLGVKSLRLMGRITEYDVVVAKQLAVVLSGGNSNITQPLSEDELLALERQAFMDLVQQPGTLARLEHMLATGKALRN